MKKNMKMRRNGLDGTKAKKEKEVEQERKLRKKGRLKEAEAI
jgi:hypothetical protein